MRCFHPRTGDTYLTNGASDLPVADTPSSVLVAGGSLADMHASFQRILVDQVRQGVFAEQLGYDFYFMPELRRACGGSPALPASAVELVPRQPTRA
jgi:hypothetical protein